MAGVKLTERLWGYYGTWEDKEFQIKQLTSYAKELIHHIEMQDKKIERLTRKNNKLERQYWEIKLKYEEE